VLTAQNGLEGLKIARNEGPDLVILDVMLPGVDGLDICYQLRTEPKTAKLPTLMLSAKAREVDKDAGRKVGVDDYITKPASPTEIINKVEALLAAQGKPVVQEKKVEHR